MVRFLMLGAYLFPGMGQVEARTSPLGVDLVETIEDRWIFSVVPESGETPAGAVARVAGAPVALADYAAPRALESGAWYFPPKDLPKLHDLAREAIPEPNTVVALRREGVVSMPLGVGPVYGVGVRANQPSSDFGKSLSLLWEQQEVGIEGPDEHRAYIDTLDRVLFLAFRFGYNLTRELYDEMGPFDADEAQAILDAINGADPKAAGGGAPT